VLQRALFGVELWDVSFAPVELMELERESLDLPDEPDKLTLLAGGHR